MTICFSTWQKAEIYRNNKSFTCFYINFEDLSFATTAKNKSHLLIFVAFRPCNVHASDVTCYKTNHIHEWRQLVDDVISYSGTPDVQLGCSSWAIKGSLYNKPDNAMAKHGNFQLFQNS